MAEPVITRREQEILGLLTQGLGNPEISRALEIDEQTVKNHLTKLFNKFQVRNRTELALTAEKLTRSKGKGQVANSHNVASCVFRGRVCVGSACPYWSRKYRKCLWLVALDVIAESLAAAGGAGQFDLEAQQNFPVVQTPVSAKNKAGDANPRP